jgi:hypothetical protein
MRRRGKGCFNLDRPLDDQWSGTFLPPSAHWRWRCFSLTAEHPRCAAIPRFDDLIATRIGVKDEWGYGEPMGIEFTGIQDYDVDYHGSRWFLGVVTRRWEIPWAPTGHRMRGSILKTTHVSANISHHALRAGPRSHSSSSVATVSPSQILSTPNLLWWPWVVSQWTRRSRGHLFMLARSYTRHQGRSQDNLLLGSIITYMLKNIMSCITSIV